MNSYGYKCLLKNASNKKVNKFQNTIYILKNGKKYIVSIASLFIPFLKYEIIMIWFLQEHLQKRKF